MLDSMQNDLVLRTHYAVGTAEDLLPKWFKEGFKPDAIVVDPHGLVWIVNY